VDPLYPATSPVALCAAPAASVPRVLLMALLLGGVVGCGGSSEPANVPVSGRVEAKGGIPVTEGKLILVPQNPLPGQKPAGATIGTDGRFTAHAATGGAGIPPGRYKVLLSFPAGMGSANAMRTAFARYAREETTPLVLDVPPAGLEDEVLEVEERSRAEAEGTAPD
jgi:hypothetical protein